MYMGILPSPYEPVQSSPHVSLLAISFLLLQHSYAVLYSFHSSPEFTQQHMPELCKNCQKPFQKSPAYPALVSVTTKERVQILYSCTS